MGVRMGLSVSVGVSSVRVSTFSDNVGLLDDFGDNRLGVSSLNDGLFVDLVTDFSVLLILSVNVSLMDNGHVLLLNESGVLLVNNWLMVLVNVLLNHDWLMMLMDNVLMMLMNDIFLVLNNYIFVMLVDHILMDLLNNGCIGVLSVLLSKFVSLNSLTFIGALVDSLLVMLDDNGFLVNLLNMGVSMGDMIVSRLVVAAITVSVLSLAGEALSVVAAVSMAVVLVAGKSVCLVVAFVTVRVLLLADE